MGVCKSGGVGVGWGGCWVMGRLAGWVDRREQRKRGDAGPGRTWVAEPHVGKRLLFALWCVAHPGRTRAPTPLAFVTVFLPPPTPPAVTFIPAATPAATPAAASRRGALHRRHAAIHAPRPRGTCTCVRAHVHVHVLLCNMPHGCRKQRHARLAWVATPHAPPRPLTPPRPR